MSRHHRFQLWLLNRQASALLRKANRPHRPSRFMVGGGLPAPLRPRLRYWILLAGLLCTVVSINATR